MVKCGIVGHLQRSAARTPERIALVDERRRWTYSQFAAAVTSCSAALVGLGLPRASRVAIYLDKSIEQAVALYAAVGAGLIAVPVNPKLKPNQVGHILRDCGASALISTAYRLGDLTGQPGLDDLHRIVVRSGARPPGERSHAHRWEDLLAESDDDTPLHEFMETDAALILYTSGSTGHPKGVVLSHRNLAVGAESVNTYFRTTGADVLLALLPFTFDAGLSQMTMAVAVGARLVLHTFLRPQEVVALCEREQVTILVGVPPLWSLLASGSWGRSGASVRLIGNTGGHMSRTLLGRLRALFPNALPYLMYGLTEAFRSSYLDPAQIDTRPDSVGKAMPNVELMLVRPDGSPCEAGEEGELVHFGPLVALGYWNDAERTAERFRCVPNALSPGLLPRVGVWSGDLFRRDAQGYLYFVGRRDEMIKSSGYRISPVEIEAVLHSAPGVREAVIFGVADEEFGQMPVAAVVAQSPPLSVPDVLAYCRRMLPGYMVPRFIEVQELPRLSNGKIDRVAVRVEHSASLAARSAA